VTRRAADVATWWAAAPLAWGLMITPAAATVTPATPTAPARVTPAWVHAYAAFGAPKYPKDFHHFEYADPAAPKGGLLALRNPDRRSSFDKFNNFTLQGNAPAGMSIFMLETLTVLSADEPRTMYGLLAQEMLIAADKSSITFRLHPLARFSNGDAVTAADVKYSFDSLAGPYASPVYSATFVGVRQVVVQGERSIRFDLTEKSSDMLFKLGALPVFSHKWGLQADGTHERFDRIVTDHPLASGPYTIAGADSGRRIEFRRNPDYWARDLPARRGFFNFDRVVYRYYQDEDIAIEAFKAGEFDIARAYAARVWMRQHKGAKWADGRIAKQAFPSGTGQGLQSYQLNLRRPLFQDIRVREALVLSYDFETTNRYRLFKRANSMFNNSAFAAQGLPSAGELRLLEPYRNVLPPKVFGPPYVAPRTDTDVGALRRNLLAARGLLQAAGWHLGADGVLRNANREPFAFEYLAPGDSANQERLNAWAQSLAKLGIRFSVRNVDFALYDRRLQEYDFDVVTIVEGAFSLPSAADYLTGYGSQSADQKGNNNLRGVKSAAVDHVVDAMSRATTMDDFRDACRALDRIVMWSYWQVPELYSDHEPISYWNKFGLPNVRPKFFTADQAPDVDPQLPWPITTWWMKDVGARSVSGAPSAPSAP
jgi:microcin C transport system substrate-binding protein